MAVLALPAFPAIPNWSAPNTLGVVEVGKWDTFMGAAIADRPKTAETRQDKIRVLLHGAPILGVIARPDAPARSKPDTIHQVLDYALLMACA